MKFVNQRTFCVKCLNNGTSCNEFFRGDLNIASFQIDNRSLDILARPSLTFDIDIKI